MRFSTLVSLGVAAGVLPHSGAIAQHVIYVNAGATGAADGTSWVDAYTDLQDALCAAEDPGGCAPGSPCEIWVTGGIYKPDSETGDRFATFQLLNNVALYGGFGGWETWLNQRDWISNETILTGDLSGDDGPEDCAEQGDCCVEHDEVGCDDAACEEIVCALEEECCTPNNPYLWWFPGCAFYASMLCCELGSANRCENSFHVVTAGGTDDSALLDGFTIAGGNADSEAANQTEGHGGGMLNEGGSPTISNCTFEGNRALWGGGAMYNTADASALLTNCLFVENRADSGGAIAGTSATDLTLIDCTFARNHAVGGAGVHTHTVSTVALINCAFDRNFGGPAVWASSTDLLAIGCSFTKNVSQYTRGAALSVGGMFRAAVLIDCDFIDNNVASGWGRAGAIATEFASLLVDGCTFLGNSAAQFPGAIRADWGNVTLRNSLFVGNAPSAVWAEYGSAAAVNCVFAGNHENAFYHQNGSVWLTNCAFIGQRKEHGGGGAAGFAIGDIAVANCVFWGNSNRHGMQEDAQFNTGSGATLDINDSIVQGWTGSYGGVGNSGDDPLFVQEGYWDDAGTPDDFSDDEWIDGDYHLQPASPAINTGDLGAPFLADTDLDGHARVLCDDIDRGAYEFGIGDFDCDQLVNLTDFTAWQACMTGPLGGSYDPGCEPFDFNADDHVDLTDFAGFQNAFTGTD